MCHKQLDLVSRLNGCALYYFVMQIWVTDISHVLRVQGRLSFCVFGLVLYCDVTLLLLQLQEACRQSLQVL